uniref:DNA-directed RNA polymerase subunit alpha n=1 Tax=Nitzschia sp. NIES-3576 TaxID=2083273 RepID=A0A2Z5ZAD5_9STRA|nr:RNA polymerase alpha subunit [Nitzschia sp. NIES-3576]
MKNIFIEHLYSKKNKYGITYGSFLIKGLEINQGITIGNYFRRVLLNDIDGIAISGIRFSDITHEFSIIPGVREDILEILLNVKGIILKGNVIKNQVGRLKVQGPAIITAGSIILPKNIKIINPNHYIMTLSTSSYIEIEFLIESGTGYKLSSQTFSEIEKDFLQLDAVFMPVQKVNFNVEIDSNNKEKLYIDIWTNGSISPVKAFLLATEISLNTFSAFNKKLSKTKEEIPLKREIAQYDEMGLEKLDLSVRIYNCLKRANINTIGLLLKCSKKNLLNIRSFGEKSFEKVSEKLYNKLGITLNEKNSIYN